MFVQATDNERIQSQLQEFTGRIEHGLREGSRRMLLTHDLADVLIGTAEVLDGRTLRYVDTDLIVQLSHRNLCS